MRAPLRIAILAGGLTLALGGARVLGWGGADGFDHEKHGKLFPSCESCHAGVADTRLPVFPAAVTCAECHDGQVEKTVDWSPPANPQPSNLRFTHPRHVEVMHQRRGADSSLACTSCHAEAGANRMSVKRTVSRQCLDCHGQRENHFAVADSACTTCHVSLAEARSLPVERVANFPEPESHRAPGFALEGHGRLTGASCATCHARDFCITCHVDAPEQRAIQALAPDPRSLAIKTELKAPPSHESADFASRHGRLARNGAVECRTCHTRESCTTCHVQEPAAARSLAMAGPGRGQGAETMKSRPASHGSDFRDSHAALAQSSPQSCAACHARTECLDCHRPTAAGTGGYHPAGFLVRHPAAAYRREVSCNDCHSSTAFCAACHEQSGLVAQRRLGSGFHDSKRNFLLGHGQAARQNLESCVSCHTERDCLICHAGSGTGGRGFSPHGPGFDPDRLRRKNPETCTACHGVNIPR